MDTFYFLDVILKFFTGVPYNKKTISRKRIGDKKTKEEEIGYIYSKRKIACYYLRTTFFIDFISLLPYFCYYFITNNAEENPKWIFLYYFKSVRLLFSKSINRSIDHIFK